MAWVGGGGRVAPTTWSPTTTSALTMAAAIIQVTTIGGVTAGAGYLKTRIPTTGPLNSSSRQRTCEILYLYFLTKPFTKLIFFSFKLV